MEKPRPRQTRTELRDSLGEPLSLEPLRDLRTDARTSREDSEEAKRRDGLRQRRLLGEADGKTP